MWLGERTPNASDAPHSAGNPTLKIVTVCCCCSVTKSSPTLCNLMNCNTLDFPVLPHLPEPAHTHVTDSVMLSDYLILCHPLSSHLQSFPASGSFPMSQLFESGGQSIGASASASVLPMNIQDWFPLGWIGCISLQSKGLSRVFSSTTEMLGGCKQNLVHTRAQGKEQWPPQETEPDLPLSAWLLWSPGAAVAWCGSRVLAAADLVGAACGLSPLGAGLHWPHHEATEQMTHKPENNHTN